MKYIMLQETFGNNQSPNKLASGFRIAFKWQKCLSCINNSMKHPIRSVNSRFSISSAYILLIMWSQNSIFYSAPTMTLFYHFCLLQHGSKLNWLLELQTVLITLWKNLHFDSCQSQKNLKGTIVRVLVGVKPTQSFSEFYMTSIAAQSHFTPLWGIMWSGMYTLKMCLRFKKNKSTANYP